MDTKKLLYTKLNALRLEVDSSIVDDIKKTVDDLIAEYESKIADLELFIVNITK